MFLLTLYILTKSLCRFDYGICLLFDGVWDIAVFHRLYASPVSMAMPLAIIGYWSSYLTTLHTKLFLIHQILRVWWSSLSDDLLRHGLPENLNSCVTFGFTLLHAVWCVRAGDFCSTWWRFISEVNSKPSFFKSSLSLSVKSSSWTYLSCLSGIYFSPPSWSRKYMVL